MKLMSVRKFLWWDKQRARGKSGFIHRTAFFWGGWMITIMNSLDLYRGRFHLMTLIISIPMYIGGGYLLGWFAWNGNEYKYQFTVENIDTLIENETNRTNQRRIA